ncbi:MAG: HRDC domain-containing protein [Actinomycetota bacterium]|nr:HRDC domain-containing protein [Actinomycetota bacterium]
MTDFRYVDDPAALEDAVERLRGCRSISVDLESDSYHHYAEKIALVQVCGGGKIFILDPLRVDLAPLADLLAERGIEKVFHDVDYDGRMLLTYLGVKPAPVFDTMIAARVLGKERIGLADLLAEYFGLAMDKRFQKADWSRRPLGVGMLEYAALDVAYLASLRDRLHDELVGCRREAWAREEFERAVEGLEPMPERTVDLRRVKGARELSPRQLAVLRELMRWREERARESDVPTFKIVGNDRLLKVAQACPRDRGQLAASGALSERQIARFGPEILKAVGRGMRAPREDLPSMPVPVHQRRDLAAEKILRELKAARDRKAAELGMDPGFLLPNAVLKAVARLKPSGTAELEESGLLKGWRLKIMKDILTSG